MSNTNTNSVEFDVVPCTNAPETTPETMEAPQTETTVPKKKTAACRIFSFLLIALCALAFFMPVQVLKGLNPENATLLASLSDLFAGNQNSYLFGVLPVYTNTANTTGYLAGLVFYVLIIEVALAALLALFALLCGKAGLFRAAAFFFATGFGAYAAFGYIIPTLEATAAGLDFIAIAFAGVGALLYLVLGFAKKGKKAFASIFQLLFTYVFTAAMVLAFSKCEAQITTVVEKFGLSFDFAALIVFAIVWVNALFGTARLLAKKGLALDMIRYIIQILLGAALCGAAFMATAENNALLIYAAVAVAVSLLQTIICIAQCKSGKPKAVKEEPVEEQPVVELEPEYTVEEYAEALPYEGGPVEGVEIAQEVNPTFEENPIEPMKVNTAGYDFYNCKSFDPFIAILNSEERNQFTELFILKYKGLMPEIPDYEVGGNNKEFFRKLFIYLGQYRDSIPDGLLAKIYQFAIRNS